MVDGIYTCLWLLPVPAYREFLDLLRKQGGAKRFSTWGKILPHGNQNGVRAFLSNTLEHDGILCVPIGRLMVITDEQSSHFCLCLG